MSEKTIHPLIQKYALSISFLTLLCMVITLGVALFDIVQIAAPQLTNVPEPYTITTTSANINEGEAPAISMETDSKVHEREIQFERQSATKSLIQALIILLIDVGLFIPHWKLSNRPVGASLAAE
jgi:hypothetical protein